MGFYPEVVLKFKIGHCARGPKRCDKCKELENNPQYAYGSYRAGFCNTPEVAHRSYFIKYKYTIGKENGEYDEVNLDVCSNYEVKSFKTEKEAKEYAEKNKLQFFIV